MAQTEVMLTAREAAVIAKLIEPLKGKLTDVRVFGSRALGTARPNSDIDIVLYGEVTEAEIDRLWTEFDESDLCVSVDVVGYEHIRYPPMRDHLDRRAKSIPGLLEPAQAA